MLGHFLVIRRSFFVVRVPAEKRIMKNEERKNAPAFFSAGPTGLEPATSCVTGKRSNQLNYDPKMMFLATTRKNRVGARNFQ